MNKYPKYMGYEFQSVEIFLRTIASGRLVRSINNCNLCGGTGKIKQPVEPYKLVKCYACGGKGIVVKVEKW